MAARGNPELSRVTVSASGMELSEAVGSIGPRMHERSKGNGLRGNIGKNVKRVSGNGIREVRDDSNAVLSIRSLI